MPLPAATSSRRRVVAVLGLIVVAGVGAVGATLWAAAEQISFEPTDTSRFRARVARPVLNGGMAALGLSAAALVLWHLGRRRPRLLVGAAAAGAAAVVALGGGLVLRAGRAHPEGARARALAALVIPPDAANSGIRVQHPGQLTAPAATRSWTMSDVEDGCGVLEGTLRTWADQGSVRPGATVSNRCYFSASWHRHAVTADAVRSGAQHWDMSVTLAG